jgi:hypothetical protein
VRGPDSALVPWEIFKVYGGQIHAVEAFMKPELCTNPPYCDGFRGRGDESVILRFD